MDTLVNGGTLGFGEFRFDIGARRIVRMGATGGGVPVALGSRALDILAVLIRQPGVLVTKDAIMREVWSNVAVEDNNLTVQITGLRKVIDGGRVSSGCIQTVTGRGYRFVAAVTRLPETAAESPRQVSAMPSALPLDRESLPATGRGEIEVGRPERRQVTALACKIVGFAALSARLDLDDLHQATTAAHRCCTEIIEQYHGHVVDCSTDGVLAYFGYPQADEHDGERAVMAALALVDAVSRLTIAAGVPLHVGVGIATGLVIAGGRDGDRTVAAVGNTPNVAIRLRERTAAGQIVIARSTRRLVGRTFELTKLGAQDLTGIAEPVDAWLVERAAVTESRFDAARGRGALTPLVGREEELDLLYRRWSQAKDGEGQVVLLSGEPGIGKSRVLGALRQRLDAHGVRALRLQCSPYHVNSAFWPIIENLERALSLEPDETTESKLDKLEALIVGQYGRALEDVRFVAAILSVPCEDRYGARPMTPQKFKDETLRTLVDLTEAAARQQPSVMLFEDAHWADPTTLEVIDLLIDRVRNVPLLVVLTHRPEFQSRWSGQGHVGALNLSKLTRVQSSAMVSALAGGKALPETLHEQILSKTDGVPLFVEELTKSILESGELKEAGDHYEYEGSHRAITVPATLRDSLMARLDRFMPVKEVAQIGAAIGREFSYELIAAVAPMAQAHSMTLWRGCAKPDSPFVVARRPTPSTPSSTRWCRTRPTTRC